MADPRWQTDITFYEHFTFKLDNWNIHGWCIKKILYKILSNKNFELKTEMTAIYRPIHLKFMK